jgi:hypothetical protein
MIFLQEQLEPASKILWGKSFTPLAQIGWMHTSNREFITEDQIKPSSGPASVIPTAIFNVNSFENWDEVEW